MKTFVASPGIAQSAVSRRGGELSTLPGGDWPIAGRADSPDASLCVSVMSPTGRFPPAPNRTHGIHCSPPKRNNSAIETQELHCSHAGYIDSPTLAFLQSTGTMIDSQAPSPGVVQQRARAALQSMFIADALSMPVHWFYNPMDILRVFPGGITDMQPAPAFHPSSIMSLHSTSGGGRGTQDGARGREIVGEVILRGKRKFWGMSNQHYHQGMPAGENTLNAWWARTLMQTLIDANGRYDQGQYLEDYIEMMTADPARHPDTYAESCHRGFFANLERGLAPDRCAAVTHDTPSVGGLVTILPLAISQLLQGQPLQDTQSLCRSHLLLTHPDELLASVCDALIELIDSLLRRRDEAAMEMLERAGRAIPGTRLQKLIDKAPSDLHVIGRQYSSACYITDSWPALLYLAGKYQHDARLAMLANTNVGGENAHRGSVLGCIVSLITGSAPIALFEQLQHRDAIAAQIEALLDCSSNQEVKPSSNA